MFERKIREEDLRDDLVDEYGTVGKYCYELKVDGVIIIYFNLGSDHQFVNNIREEIIERLEPLWDVKKVKVIFNDKS